MAFAYSEFDSTPGTLVADIKTKVLLSSDWSNPTGQVLQATAANGATMCVDLVGGGAATNAMLSVKFWRLFSAGTGTDAYQRYLAWNNTTPASTVPLHCKVSAGNTLLYVEVEGPRASEAGADSTLYGSYRQYFFIAQLTSYMSADAVPAVVAGGCGFVGQTGPNLSNNYAMVYCATSRNQANTASWVAGRLFSLGVPSANPAGGQYPSAGWGYNPYASDGSTYLLPYVLFEDTAGLRGRLTDLYHAGTANGTNAQDALNSNLAPGQLVTYGGNTYKVTCPNKSSGQSPSQSSGSLGYASNYGVGGGAVGPLAAIRTI